jgi:hypothetical protein
MFSTRGRVYVYVCTFVQPYIHETHARTHACAHMHMHTRTHTSFSPMAPSLRQERRLSVHICTCLNWNFERSLNFTLNKCVHTHTNTPFLSARPCFRKQSDRPLFHPLVYTKRRLPMLPWPVSTLVSTACLYPCPCTCMTVHWADSGTLVASTWSKNWMHVRIHIHMCEQACYRVVSPLASQPLGYTLARRAKPSIETLSRHCATHVTSGYFHPDSVKTCQAPDCSGSSKIGDMHSFPSGFTNLNMKRLESKVHHHTCASSMASVAR